MEITASMVKELRESTGAGMLDCKKALTESDGDMDKAVEWLREKGIAKSAKKESRIAAEGLANIFVDGNKAVILEVNSETDFVSKNSEFQKLIDTIGKAILANGAKTMEDALAIKLDEGTVEDLIISKTATIGEKLSFRRFELVEKSDNENFGAYLHMGGRIAALTVVEGASEEVAKDVSMQAAAMYPRYVFKKDVPQDVVAKEREILKEQAMEEGKPEDIAIKMVEGRLNKFYKEVCLTLQAFIKDGDLSVEKYVANNGGKVVKMIRYEVGDKITLLKK